MATENHDNDNPQTGIGSTEYRTKLLTKLNCLMAVLEVAIGKIDKTMELPSANQERLTKIRANLQNTLAICSRARGTLERAATGPQPIEADTNKADRSKPKALPSTKTDPESMSYRDYVELSSIEEYQKFKTLPPIGAKDLASADVDDLLRKLYES